jgi:hypothetical protein
LKPLQYRRRELSLLFFLKAAKNHRKIFVFVMRKVVSSSNNLSHILKLSSKINKNKRNSYISPTENDLGVTPGIKACVA